MQRCFAEFFLNVYAAFIFFGLILFVFMFNYKCPVCLGSSHEVVAFKLRDFFFFPYFPYFFHLLFVGWMIIWSFCCAGRPGDVSWRLEEWREGSSGREIFLLNPDTTHVYKATPDWPTPIGWLVKGVLQVTRDIYVP